MPIIFSSDEQKKNYKYAEKVNKVFSSYTKLRDSVRHKEIDDESFKNQSQPLIEELKSICAESEPKLLFNDLLKKSVNLLSQINSSQFTPSEESDFLNMQFLLAEQLADRLIDETKGGPDPIELGNGTAIAHENTPKEIISLLNQAHDYYDISLTALSTLIAKYPEESSYKQERIDIALSKIESCEYLNTQETLIINKLDSDNVDALAERDEVVQRISKYISTVEGIIQKYQLTNKNYLKKHVYSEIDEQDKSIDSAKESSAWIIELLKKNRDTINNKIDALEQKNTNSETKTSKKRKRIENDGDTQAESEDTQVEELSSNPSSNKRQRGSFFPSSDEKAQKEVEVQDDAQDTVQKSNI